MNSRSAKGIVGTDIRGVNAEEGENHDPNGIGGGDDSDADEGVSNFGPSRFDFSLVATRGKPLNPTPNHIDKDEDAGEDDGGVDDLKDELGDAFEAEKAGDLGTDVDSAVACRGQSHAGREENIDGVKG